MWDIFESGRIQSVVSGLDKKKGYGAICAISYNFDDPKRRDKKSAAIKDKDSEDGKKIMGLIENFRDMKGACNNWAGILLNTNIQLVVYSWFRCTII